MLAAMAEPRVRPVRREDLPGLTRIYNHYVSAGPVTFDVQPFTPSQREAWLDQFAEQGPHRLLVLEEGGALRGYAGSMPFRAKPAYATSVEVTIYLAPDATGAGRGRRLYEALFSALAGEDLHRAYAGITLPNDASLRLHRRFGFQEVGVFREVGRKVGRYWDVAWYEKSLPHVP
jgi:phosphinothricin acetyltransferase